MYFMKVENVSMDKETLCAADYNTQKKARLFSKKGLSLYYNDWRYL